MTEPIPALAYQSRPLIDRRPIFVALAILAIVFSALAAYSSLMGGITYWASVQAQRARTPGIYWPYMQYVISQLLSVPGHLTLGCAGIAFLLKSRWTVTFLCIYAGLYIFTVVIALLLNTLVPAAAGAQVSFTNGLARSVMGLSRGIFEVAVLMLLCNNTVRAVIYRATGVPDDNEALVTN